MTSDLRSASGPADTETDTDSPTTRAGVPAADPATATYEPSADEPLDPPAIDEDGLAAGKAIQRRTGRTFHMATRLFPAEVRHATYVLYGFVRIADEVVDGPGESDPDAQREAIDRLRAVAIGDEPTDDPVLAAFQTVRDARGIRGEDVAAFLDSMAADVDGEGARYRTTEELDDYVHGSAAAVGHMMTAVMGVDDPAARPHAAALGAAFQLTNFLRDVREDVVDLDRVYLPERVLERHGASHDEIEALAFDGRVAAAVEDELRRAETFYREGVAGIRYLPEGCQFPVLAAAALYAEYHREIRRRDFDVLSARPSLGTARKLAVLARVGYHWLRTRDPEAAFYAASAVPRVPDEPAAGSPAASPGRVGGLRGRLPGAGRWLPGISGWYRGD